MFKAYGDYKSGNCYKMKLILSLLDLPYEWIPVDIMNDESRTSSFLEKNPNGKIPVLELPDGRMLPESNAILHYVAEGSDFLPTDRFEHAQVIQWMNFEQYSHEPNIATSRYIIIYLGKPESRLKDLEERKEPGYQALQVMEDHLKTHDFFVGNRYTIADITLYAYTHVAEEGEYDLSRFPVIHAWFERIVNHPNHVTMLG